MDFFHVQGALARDGFPMRLVHVIADHGGDDTIPVDHADVGSVREIQYVVGGYSYPLGIGQFGVSGQGTVSAMGFVAGKTAFSRSNYRFPVVVRVGIIVGIADSDNLMGFRVGNVEGTVQWTESYVITVRDSRCAERENIDLMRTKRYLDYSKRAKFS